MPKYEITDAKRAEINKQFTHHKLNDDQLDRYVGINHAGRRIRSDNPRKHSAERGPVGGDQVGQRSEDDRERGNSRRDGTLTTYPTIIGPDIPETL